MQSVHSEQIIAAFRDVATASVSDALQAMNLPGHLSTGIRQIVPGKLVGPAVTVREVPTTETEPPTHALRLIDESPAGSVVCIDAGGTLDVAVWGGLMTAGAVANQLAGAVLDGAVRDVEEILRDYDLPIYARGTSPGTTLGSYRTVSANEPVVCGGVTVHAGDLIVADTDGVVCVPAAHVADVLAAAVDIENREREQAKLILASGSLAEGLARYNRI
ncbi:RraA family protein [Allokutzneria sp. A3M-2-11 16]|uniref:RraA family protein n=1 Tax=Allokutzneria sp. A3M-2-11 16 TaxID=2962043 RepID=UPI0020B8B5F2|nr:RraA family protein [Allokutzneria sp. A3M-2-11 16]MCP3804849.1 RraA family protein [Allokutzneria sp. A3M-2-11 16]